MTEIRLGDGLESVSLSVFVDSADGVDGACGASGVCRGNDLAVGAGDGGADLSGDVLRKGSDNRVSAGGTVGGSDCRGGARRGSLVSGGDGDGDGLGLPFNNLLAGAAGQTSSSRNKRGEREGSDRREGKLHRERTWCFSTNKRMTTPGAAKEGLEVRLNESGRRSGCRWLRMERERWAGGIYL